MDNLTYIENRNARGRFGLLQRLVFIALAIGFGYGLMGAAAGATLLTGFSETMVSGGLTSPTAMDFAPDGRLFVCLQGGQLRVIKNGALLATPFLTLTVDARGERGLLGVAFDPDFANNNFVYVYYTVPESSAPVSPAHNRVSRFTANSDVAASGSEFVLLNLDPLSAVATNHNGGAIHFGPDGKLYIAVGENANPPNSQTLNTLLGKLLRINSDHSIPTDNPFFNAGGGARQEIWALGLRNPFTFAFQPGTGRMFINDVGQNTWEEINDGIAGSNYGWPITEGPTNDPSFRGPLFAYQHGGTSFTGCAIVGGGFYNPPVVQFPSSYVGKYFFADLCSGWIRLFDPAHNTASDFASGVSTPVDLKVAADGTLYYLAIGSAAVFRIQATASLAQLRIDTVTPQAGQMSGGQTITLTGAFSNLSAVTMGGGPVSSLSGNASTITFTTPLHAVGAVQIDLRSPSGSVYTKTNAFAYLPTVFTDNMIMVGQTTAKAQHIIELRQAIDALRNVAGLGPAPWTDPSLTGNTIKAIHIQELRTWLDDVATRLGYSTSDYTDSGLTPGFMIIKGVHIEELRQKIRAIAG